MGFKILAAQRMLQAMSKYRPEVEKTISSYEDRILEHVMKVYVYGSCEPLRGWLKELKAWYVLCTKQGNNLRKGNKLKLKDYQEFLFPPGVHTDAIFRNIVEIIIDDIEDLQPREDLDMLKMEKDVAVFYAVMLKCMSTKADWSVVEKELLKIANVH